MKIVWTEAALGQLVSIRNFIAENSESNAALVAARILETIQLLESRPEIGRPGEVPGTRELAIPRTPYVLVYRVLDGGLRLLAIFHGRQQRPTSL